MCKFVVAAVYIEFYFYNPFVYNYIEKQWVQVDGKTM